MPGAYEFWKKWEQMLSQWQLQKTAAIVLESGGAFNILISQVVYLAQPLFPIIKQQEIGALADLLEDSEACTAFASYLNKDVDR